MNIMVNDYCNLNCKYCFAGVNKNHNDISDENMFKYISFLKRSNHRSLRILGGEPTINPSFARYVQTANSDDFFQEVMIFTNGYALTPQLIDEIFSHKLAFLINLNKKEDIGEHKYNKTIENITYLVNKYRENNMEPKVLFGINIYEKDFDYKYIVEETKRLELKTIRYSITVPKKAGKQIEISYYSDYIPQLKKFLRECYDNKITTALDCNNIPKCLFTKEELIELQLCGHDLCYKNGCNMPLDVNLNLEVTRCFPFFDKFRVNLNDYKDMKELTSYFYNNIDYFKYEQPTFKECNDCSMFKNKMCQAGCMAYKLGR